MIYVIIMAFVTLAFMGIFWYIMHVPLIHIIKTLTSNYPGAYEPSVTSFIENVILLFLAIVVFAVLNWVYVNTQKPKEVPYG